MDAESSFTTPWDLSDVAFAVEGRYIYANKTILSMWSPVLKAMFGGSFRESSADVVELPGKLYDDLLELVRVLHPPNKPIDENNVVILLPLAREYQIDDLMKRCEQFLLCRKPCVRSLVLAEEFTLKALQQQCLDHVNSSSLKALFKESEFQELSDKTRIDILLDKATRYEQLLDEVRATLSGERPQQMRFRVGGTLCTFTCSDKTFADGPHNAGTESSCKSCAVYMTKLLGEKITEGDLPDV